LMARVVTPSAARRASEPCDQKTAFVQSTVLPSEPHNPLRRKLILLRCTRSAGNPSPALSTSWIVDVYRRASSAIWAAFSPLRKASSVHSWSQLP
jgi:hypothetical protein